MTEPRMPAALLLDAGGTLIEERTSRAELYARAARGAGLDVDEARAGTAMARVHGELPRQLGAHFRYARGWFERFLELVLVRELGLDPALLSAVSEELFAVFADPATYRALPGALELCAALRERGVRLAVVSNWSPALHGLLTGLGLAEQLEFALVSAEQRLEKPDPALFGRALARLDLAATRVAHLGNDPERDAAGARAAGLEPLLVGPPHPGCASFPDLGAVQRALCRRTA
ncbi:MAG TPA: HAD family hydrolase [Planctomycetota bacterium]|nr:HAD family hydrolase [Planctomycetota bacterium]